ncbi:hypothetical protein CDL15_Pgr003391 [Punica granatum]|uniref:Glycosyltransferase n=1 Tax=Punica granatum TaxID=22663 RepID=A0A218X3D2_PUNGR|nr:hypothetical protein CDL15_Pgr003391 [Punica granatum]
MSIEGETNGTNDTTPKLHIFFFPLLAQGHIIPVIDMVKLFSTRGVKSTLITTTYNEPLFLRSIERTRKLGFDIQVVTLTLPLEESSRAELLSTAAASCAESEAKSAPFAIFRKAQDDSNTPSSVRELLPIVWADHRNEFGPRMEHALVKIVFVRASYGLDAWTAPTLTSTGLLLQEEILEILSRKKLSSQNFFKKMMESELRSYRVVMNSFYELEPIYADLYGDVSGRQSLGVDLLFLCNQDMEDKKQRGNRVAIGEDGCLKWLNSKEPDSVVYICFGSMSTSQLHEIAKGLEASGEQFVWVVKKDDSVEEGKEEWLPQGQDAREGPNPKGWAPHVLILDHWADGGFVTHCRWNSTLEGISSGVPMVTWPVAAEQFSNEKLIIEVLRIGVPVGVKRWMRQVGDSVESEKVEKAVRRMMVGEEAEEMRVKARELSNMAKRAVEEGGSSHSKLTVLLEELKFPKVAAH